MLTRKEKFVMARALSRTFTKAELQARLRAALENDGQRITSWTDIGLSSAVSYDFSLSAAIDILSAALDIQAGKRISRTGIKRIKFFP